MFEPAALGIGTGFHEDTRFSGTAPGPEAPACEPLEDAFARGYAAGAAAERQAAVALTAIETRCEEAFAASFQRLDAEIAERLRQQLRETVLALCEATLTDAALDPDGLARRIERAVALLARAGDERTIRLHPDDLARLSPRLPPDWTLQPDPALERGALRVEAANGGVEDGPEQWRRALAEALGAC